MKLPRPKRRLAAGDPSRHETRQLANGRQVHIRPITPADAEPIATGFHLLSDEEVRRRFLHPVKALSAEHLFQLTHPDPGRAFVLVVSEPLAPGSALIGAVARLAVTADDPGSAEFGLLVSHYISGLGLGKVLLQRLLDWARRQGLREIWGDVLEENVPMLQLAESLGSSAMARIPRPACGASGGGWPESGGSKPRWQVIAAIVHRAA